MADESPKLPLTVPLHIWQAFATAVRPTFADSYLSGAYLDGNRLVCRTFIACNRLMADAVSKRLLGELGLIPCGPDGARHKDWGRKLASPVERRQLVAMLPGRRDR